MSSRDHSTATENFNKLIQFRQAAYERFGNGRDALFELTDAVIQLRQVQSFAELSCAPAFRRKWSSAYEAVQDGRPQRMNLAKLYLSHLPDQERLIFAVDHTAWERLWAETLPGRAFHHQPTPVLGRRPVTIGHGYSTLAVVPEMQGSWALPLLHERLTDQKPVELGAQQLEQICNQLIIRPISLLDSEYGCAAFLLCTAHVHADKLFRLRSNLSLEGPTKPRTSPKGQAPKHGIPFKFKDPTTWWESDEELEYDDPRFGPMKVRIWKKLRFSQALDCYMTIALVERLQGPDTRRKPRLLWFGWVGEEPPEHWWSLYSRRYPVDHWYRFAKGRLHWTLPRFSTAEQCQRWSDLMPFLTWELWLARSVVADHPLPWQKPQGTLAPGRVCQGLQSVLLAIGTPARACKSRGNAPGWPSGKPRTPRPSYELVRSARWKQIRKRKYEKKLAEKAKSDHPEQVAAVPPT